jgi:hypothetical protein
VNNTRPAAGTEEVYRYWEKEMERRRREEDRDEQQGHGGIYNGSTKLITSLLALMNILTAAAIVGGVVMYGRVTALDQKVDLIITGHIRIANGP